MHQQSEARTGIYMSALRRSPGVRKRLPRLPSDGARPFYRPAVTVVESEKEVTVGAILGSRRREEDRPPLGRPSSNCGADASDAFIVEIGERFIDQEDRRGRNKPASNHEPPTLAR